MALSKIDAANFLDGTLPDTNINNASLDNVTALPGAIPTGKVLQVVSVSHTSQTSTSGTSYSDMGISASITPSSASNTILVNYSLSALTYRLSSGYYRGWIKTLRGTTDIQEDFFGAYLNVGTDDASYGVADKFFIDSPSSTSSLTYKLQFKVDSGGTMIVSESSKISNITLMEIEG